MILPILPERPAMDYQREDVHRLKELYGFSWTGMSRYFGYADGYWKQKYYGGQHFHKSDAALLWLMEMIKINKLYIDENSNR